MLQAMAVALRDVHSGGFDIREAAEHSILAAVAEDCAEARLAAAPGG